MPDLGQDGFNALLAFVGHLLDLSRHCGLEGAVGIAVIGFHRVSKIVPPPVVEWKKTKRQTIFWLDR
jgi:hypothetical protein